MIEKARMLKTHLANILTYLRHRITNATAEGLKSKIQWIRHTARSFRNRENFKTAIYFHSAWMAPFSAVTSLSCSSATAPSSRSRSLLPLGRPQGARRGSEAA